MELKEDLHLLIQERVEHIYADPHEKAKFRMHFGDLTDASNLIRIIQKVKPDEIYNLGAQSHVKVSFPPEYTANSDALGTIRMFEAIKNLNMEKSYDFIKHLHQKCLENLPPQNEITLFQPRSPYAAALYSYWVTKFYREAYNIFACNGILFNHESPLKVRLLFKKNH